MDTISRESNTSYLPFFGVGLGVVALVLAGVALAKASSLSKKVDEQAAQISQVDALSEQVRGAVAASDKANSGISKLAGDTNAAFAQVAQELGNMRGEITKVQDSVKSAPPPAAATASKSSGPVTAGPNEYVVRSGDTGTKIASSLGVSVGDLQAVNPGVNWNRLQVGQKIKTPKK